MTMMLENPAFRRILHPVSVQQYHQLLESGIVAEKTELIRGLVVDKMTLSPRHVFVCQAIYELLLKQAEGDWLVRQQQPLTLCDSEPEPDVAVVAGENRRYLDEHPTTAALIVEVAVSSVDIDRDKAGIYAEAGVPEYWIVSVDSKQIEVRRELENGVYNSVELLEVPAVIRPGAFPTCVVPLTEVFPF